MAHLRRSAQSARRLAAVLAVVLTCVTSCAEPEVETEPSIGQVERTESITRSGWHW